MMLGVEAPGVSAAVAPAAPVSPGASNALHSYQWTVGGLPTGPDEAAQERRLTVVRWMSAVVIVICTVKISLLAASAGRWVAATIFEAIRCDRFAAELFDRAALSRFIGRRSNFVTWLRTQAVYYLRSCGPSAFSDGLGIVVQMLIAKTRRCAITSCR